MAASSETLRYLTMSYKKIVFRPAAFVQDQNISSSFLVPPRPVFMLAAHSRQALFENGKSFVHFLQTGFLHSGHAIEAVRVLQM